MKELLEKLKGVISEEDLNLIKESFDKAVSEKASVLAEAHLL